MTEQIPEWAIGALVLATLGIVWAGLRWLRSRLEGGEIVVVSRSGEQLRGRVSELEAELARERSARHAAGECARCATEARDAAQERVIQILERCAAESRRAREERDAVEDPSRCGSGGGVPAGDGCAAPAGGGLDRGVLRGRGRGE